MSEIEQAAWTAAFTLLVGTLLFIFGEFAKVLIVVPLQKYKEQVQATLDRVEFYSNQLTNYFSDKPDKQELERMRQISTDIRSAETQLKSKYIVISFKRLLAIMRLIPTKKQLDDACSCLSFLSANLPQAGRARNRDHKYDQIELNGERIEEIKELLG